MSILKKYRKVSELAPNFSRQLGVLGNIVGYPKIENKPTRPIEKPTQEPEIPNFMNQEEDIDTSAILSPSEVVIGTWMNEKEQVILPKDEYHRHTLRYFMVEEANRLIAKYQPELDSLNAERERIKGIRDDETISKRRKELDDRLIPHVKEQLRYAKQLFKKPLAECAIALRTKINDNIELAYKTSEGLLSMEQRKFRINELEQAIIKSQDTFEFFPTPAIVIEDMIKKLRPIIESKAVVPQINGTPEEYERIKRDSVVRILEPSAGTGDLADAIMQNFGEYNIEVSCIEIFNDSRDLLRMKGYDLIGQDFTKFSTDDDHRFDIIIMNPPFAHGDDIAHVKHAMKQLKVDGYIYAVTSLGAVSGSDVVNINFRKLFEEDESEIYYWERDTMRSAKKQATVQIVSLFKHKLEEDDLVHYEHIIPQVGTYLKDMYFVDKNIWQVYDIEGEVPDLIIKEGSDLDDFSEDFDDDFNENDEMYGDNNDTMDGLSGKKSKKEFAQGGYHIKNIVTDVKEYIPFRHTQIVKKGQKGTPASKVEVVVPYLEFRFLKPTQEEIEDAIQQRKTYMAKRTDTQSEPNGKGRVSCGGGDSELDGECNIPFIQLEKDTAVKPIRFITARPEYTKRANGNYVDGRFSKLVNAKGQPIIFDHVFEGANKSIESIDFNNRRAFLLADGTGTGKTIQELMVAYYMVTKYKKPALIVTEADKIITQSFLGDAEKIGIKDMCVKIKDKTDFSDIKENSQKIYFCKFKDAINWYKATGSDEDGNGGQQTHDVAIEFQATKGGWAMAKADLAKQLKAIEKDGGSKEYKAEMKKRAKQDFNNDWRVIRYHTMAKKWWDTQYEMFGGVGSKLSICIYDEAHNLRNHNPYDYDSKMANRMTMIGEGTLKAGGGLMFATATPIDKAEHMLYLKYIGMFKDEEHYIKAMKSAGWHWSKPLEDNEKNILMPGRWEYNKGFPPEIAFKRIEELFEDLTEDGGMLKREVALDNATVNIISIKNLPREAKRVLKHLDSIATGKSPLEKSANKMESMRAIEPFKLSKAIDLISQEISIGKSVVAFTNLQTEGIMIHGSGLSTAGTAKILHKQLANEFGGGCIGLLTGDRTETQRLNDVDNFQLDCKKLIVATSGSGGTGISLDDQDIYKKGQLIKEGGYNPRALICLTAPMSAFQNVQMLGRITRANTRSRTTAYYMFAEELGVEEWLRALVARKMKMLNASVVGETGKLDISMLDALDETGGSIVDVVIDETGNKGYKPQIENHPLFESKDLIKGADMPSPKPYNVQKIVRDNVAREIIIRANNLRQINQFMQLYNQEIDRFEFKKLSDMQGSYLYAKYSDDAWNFVLNMLMPYNLSFTYGEKQLFEVGSKVVSMIDLIEGGVKIGDTGTVEQVRKRGLTTTQSYYIYKVKWDNGKTTNRIYQSQLVAPENENSPKRMSIRDTYFKHKEALHEVLQESFAVAEGKSKKLRYFKPKYDEFQQILYPPVKVKRLTEDSKIYFEVRYDFGLYLIDGSFQTPNQNTTNQGIYEYNTGFAKLKEVANMLYDYSLLSHPINQVADSSVLSDYNFYEQDTDDDIDNLGQVENEPDWFTMFYNEAKNHKPKLITIRKALKSSPNIYRAFEEIAEKNIPVYDPTEDKKYYILQGEMDNIWVSDKKNSTSGWHVGGKIYEYLIDEDDVSKLEYR